MNGINRSRNREGSMTTAMAQTALEGQRHRVQPQTRPEIYRHWKLNVDGQVATLTLDVAEDGGIHPGYALKLNTYDLGVDIELADAVNRMRFEHPEVSVVVITSARERVFCAGANIFMLRGSTHPFKVNFCKYTNETRLAIEEATEISGQTYLAALNGVCSGGGYELALACKEIHLIDDRSSTVSLPEVPFLGVLPGTGGLTRLVDKRKVRRDLADVFSTLAEGVKGQKAVEWRLVDAVHPASRWDEAIAGRAAELRSEADPERAARKGIVLEPLEKSIGENRVAYRHLTLDIDPAARTATVTLRAPEQAAPLPGDPTELGSAWYPLALFRELDDALVELRFNYEEAGLLQLRSEGNMDTLLEYDRQLQAAQHHWFGQETLLFIRRTLKRLDLMARTLFTFIEPGSCFGGFLLETALASDRIYMMEDAERPVEIALTALNRDAFPMGNGLSRLAQRFLGEPEQVEIVLSRSPARFSAPEALEAGLVTSAPDDLDWDDEVRLAVEERASFSPDALTGMEANLRSAGPETMETKIFGRLSAWQNWIFQRPNATGEKGALSLYGEPNRPQFDHRRT